MPAISRNARNAKLLGCRVLFHKPMYWRNTKLLILKPLKKAYNLVIDFFSHKIYWKVFWIVIIEQENSVLLAAIWWAISHLVGESLPNDLAILFIAQISWLVLLAVCLYMLIHMPCCSSAAGFTGESVNWHSLHHDGQHKWITLVGVFPALCDSFCCWFQGILALSLLPETLIILQIWWLHCVSEIWDFFFFLPASRGNVVELRMLKHLLTSEKSGWGFL